MNDAWRFARDTIAPPGLTFEQALRRGFLAEIRMPGYLAWLRTLPCRCHNVAVDVEASHGNFFKSQTRKGPDPLALPECRPGHELYERGGPDEQARLAAAAIYMLQAIYEGRLKWQNI